MRPERCAVIKERPAIPAPVPRRILHRLPQPLLLLAICRRPFAIAARFQSRAARGLSAVAMLVAIVGYMATNILALGLVIGGAATILVELLDTSFKKVADVEEFLGLPVLGIAPKIEYMSKVTE